MFLPSWGVLSGWRFPVTPGGVRRTEHTALRPDAAGVGSFDFGSVGSGTPAARRNSRSMDLTEVISAPALAGIDTVESSKISISWKSMPPSSRNAYLIALKPIETARTRPALISPHAVSRRSFSEPGSVITGISASNSMPLGVGLFSRTVPIGDQLSCWWSSVTGLENFAPMGSMVSLTRSISGVVAQPENIRRPVSTSSTALVIVTRL